MKFLVLSLFFFFVFSKVLHEDDFIKARKYEGKGCTGNVTYISYTELMHCVPTKSPLGVDIWVFYFNDQGQMKLNAYFFRSDCKDRGTPVKTKEINVNECFEGYYRYDLLDTREELDQQLIEDEDEVQAAGWAVYLRYMDGEMCEEIEDTYRWEYHLSYSGFCTKPIDKCDDYGTYSRRVICWEQDAKYFNIPYYINKYKGTLVILVVVILLLVVALIVVLVMVLVSVGIILLIKGKKKGDDKPLLGKDEEIDESSEFESEDTEESGTDA